MQKGNTLRVNYVPLITRPHTLRSKNRASQLVLSVGFYSNSKQIERNIPINVIHHLVARWWITCANALEFFAHSGIQLDVNTINTKANTEDTRVSSISPALSPGQIPKNLHDEFPFFFPFFFFFSFLLVF